MISKTIVIGSIIGILFLVLVVIGIYLASQKWTERPEENKAVQIETFVQAQDIANSQSIDSSYILDYTSNETPTIVSQGQLIKDTFIPLTLDHNKVYHFNCWNDDYYLVKASKLFSGEETQQKKARFICSMTKIGKLEIGKEGRLQEGTTNIIKLNITSKEGSWFRLAGCFSWSAGIINAYLPNNLLTCKESTWLNWSILNSTTQKYEYYPKGTYRCGEQIENCDEIINNKCKIEGIDIPSRFRNRYDDCFYTGKSLTENESYELTIEVKTLEYLNSLDFLKITLFDYDRRYDETENKFIWTSEKNGEDVAGEDIDLQFDYLR